MGLKLTLGKETNRLYHDFIDAYWAVTSISYDTDRVWFTLSCFPTRDSKLKNLATIETPSIGFGAVSPSVVGSELYRWDGVFNITDIFPQGIPLSSDDQKTTIYNFIKRYTELPFEDVFEEDQA